MSFNNGKSLDINKITNIEEAIKDFSEGNVYLQKLLLECYSNNIKTFACCKGHEKDDCLPYIAFLYSKENEQFIYYLLSELKDSDIEFRYNKTSITNSYFNLEFKNYDYKCFQIIIDLINKFDKSKNYLLDLTIDLQNYFNIINTIEYSEFIKSDNNTNSNYFQFGYVKEDDSYNYFSFSNNHDYLRLLKNSGFNYNDQGILSFYSINSSERNKNNEQLEKMNYVLNKELNKLFIPNDIMNKSFDELNIHFDYQDNDRSKNFLRCELGDTIDEISIKLAICKIRNINAYTIINNIEVNNYKTIDPNEIRNNYIEQINTKKTKR